MKNAMKKAGFLGVLIALVAVGSQTLLPVRAEAAPAISAQAQTKLVNINRADSAELESVRGIGPVLAQKILGYRKTNGDFKRVDDLVNVPGIGPAKFEKIKAQITV